MKKKMNKNSQARLIILQRRGEQHTGRTKARGNLDAVPFQQGISIKGE